MSNIADVKNRRKRKSRAPPGEDLVIGELLRRGFRGATFRSQGTCPARSGLRLGAKPIQVKTVHSTPWYVRRASFARSPADQVTVYVLLELERGTWSARFFVARNSDLAAQFRQPSTSNPVGFIDAQSVERYEDNWEILR